MEPMDRIDPTDPMERIDPFELIESTESVEFTDQREVPSGRPSLAMAFIMPAEIRVCTADL
jgi:hypothetical protein